MASKGLGPLPRRRGSALAHGCGRGGRVVLPLPRAAAVSTGLRVLATGDQVRGAVCTDVDEALLARDPRARGLLQVHVVPAQVLFRVRVGVRVRVRVRARVKS